jgi:hypothetical protein
MQFRALGGIPSAGKETTFRALEQQWKSGEAPRPSRMRRESPKYTAESVEKRGPG